MFDSVKEIWNAYSEEEKKMCAFATAIAFLTGVVLGMLIAPAKKKVILIGNSGNKMNLMNDRKHRKEDK